MTLPDETYCHSSFICDLCVSRLLKLARHVAQLYSASKMGLARDGAPEVAPADAPDTPTMIDI